MSQFGFSCPVCGNTAPRFLPFGLVPRPNAMCPFCRSLERHRLAWLFLCRMRHLFAKDCNKMLHIAPEQCLSLKFRSLPTIEYLSADLNRNAAMVQMDITQITYPDQSFDIIFCSHVLEHIIEDAQAIIEMYRVLKTGGWAIFMVPISGATTYEDFSIVEASEREAAFGQWDHVRIYGSDFKVRLSSSGFVVNCMHPEEFITPLGMHKMSLRSNDWIYLCFKNSPM